MILAKTYRLVNTIQNYDWGTRNENAFIPKLLGLEIEIDKPYAELWIGAHPKAPSKVIIGNSEIELYALIEKFPAEILGQQIAKKFGNKLPFLLKVLSTEKALSIQAHPDKKLAAVLHKKDPINYPDDNHKPEIAIAIDNLDAIVGFKSATEINKIVEKYSSLKNYVETRNLRSANQIDISHLYSSILKQDGEELKGLIEGIRGQILQSGSSSKPERIFLEQYDNFGIDAGLISILLFNLVELKKDEAIFTGAGVPHAYLRGNIIECMANSDNVVRAGLTPKYKDVPTLLEMIDYDNRNMNFIQANNENEKVYNVPVDEFEIRSINLKTGETRKFKEEGFAIGLLLEGLVNVNSEKGSEEYQKGESFLVPAIANNFEINSSIPSILIFVTIS